MASQSKGQDITDSEDLGLEPVDRAEELAGSRMPARSGTSHFENYDPTDSRLLLRATIRPSETIEGSGVQLRDYDTKYLNEDGSVRRSETLTVASFEKQDTLDLLAYFQDDSGKFYIGISHQARYAQALRDAEVLDTGELLTKSPLYPNLPGGYLEDGIERIVDRILSERLGVSAAGELEHLGGAYFSSVGYQTEAVFPRAIEVHPPVDDFQVRYAEGFEQTRGAEFLELSEVVKRSLSGELLDGRLLEATLRFARYKGIELDIDVPLPELQGSLRTNEAFESLIRSPKELEDMLWSNDVQERLASELKIERSSTLNKDSFVSEEGYQVTQLNQNAESLGEINVTVIDTKGKDCVDLGACVLYQGEIYFAVQRGPRPSIAAREEDMHPIQMQQNPLHIDGVAGFLFKENPNEEEIAAKVNEIAAHKLDATIRGEVGRLGAAHTSPGYMRERAYRAFAEIEIESIGADQLKEVYFLKGSDILKLSDQGMLRDGRLSTMVELARLRYPEAFSSSSVDEFSPEIRDAYRSLINSASPAEVWLSEVSPDMHHRLRAFPEYRRLLTYSINEVGFRFDKFEHPEETYFFRANVPVFADYPTAKPHKWPMNLIHDLMHYYYRDLLPHQFDDSGKVLRDESGKPNVMSFEDYEEATNKVECRAVGFSDIKIQKLFGLSEAETISWRGKIGRIAEELELNEKQIDEFVEEIELHGIIRPELIAICRDNPQFVVPLRKLLEFHHKDHHQIRIFYDNWVRLPETAETILRFGRSFTDKEKFLEHAETSKDGLTSYPEGVNMLKYALRSAANVDFQEVALQLSYVADQISLKSADGSIRDAQEKLLTIREAVDEAVSAHQELSALAEQVTSIDESDSNLGSFERLQVLERGSLQHLRDLSKGLMSDSSIFNEAELAALEGRRFPAFDSQKLPSELEQSIQATINNTLLELGLLTSDEVR